MLDLLPPQQLELLLQGHPGALQGHFCQVCQILISIFLEAVLAFQKGVEFGKDTADDLIAEIRGPLGLNRVFPVEGGGCLRVSKFLTPLAALTDGRSYMCVGEVSCGILSTLEMFTGTVLFWQSLLGQRTEHEKPSVSKLPCGV